MLIVNADLYLPNMPKDKTLKIGECCKGLVNLELLIHHIAMHW